MSFGRFQPETPLGSGPSGPIFLAKSEGVEWEIRTLDRLQSKAAEFGAVKARCKLFALLSDQVFLRPIDWDFESETPYLVVPRNETATPLSWADRPITVALELVALVVGCHRLGMTLGRINARSLRRISSGQVLLDISGTGVPGLPMLPGTSTPEMDIATLAGLLEELFNVPVPLGEVGSANFVGLNAMLAVMKNPDPQERPLALDVAKFFGVETGKTHHDVEPLLAQHTPPIPVTPVPAAKDPDLDETADPTPPEAPVAVHNTDSDLLIITPLEMKGQAPNEVVLPQTGEYLGRFLLLEKLGQGGMGIVYKAEDQADGTIVAIKILRPEAMQSATSRRRFVKEARLLAALDTPNVTRLIAADMDGDICYMAVEYVPGKNLADWLRDNGIPTEKAALEMIADAARGLAIAHQAGIIHRDIKPENLLVLPKESTGPRVKVTDFGLARKTVQSESLEVTRAGAMLGTPRYMSPEQFGARPVDARSDVYSLGSTLYQLLSGQAPFPQDNILALARAVSSEAPPALEKLNPAISSATSELVNRTLSKEPSGRPADAAILLRDLELLINGNPTNFHAHPKSPGTTPRTSEYVYTWELLSTPNQLWPHVSNTERLNKAIGLPSVQYEIRKDPSMGTRRFAHAKVAGFKMVWEEHPFEWVEGRRMGILREFAQGPFKWMLSFVELLPNNSGGTTLRHTLRGEPRGILGRIAVPMNLGRKSRLGLETVYRRIDSVIQSKEVTPTADDPFQPLTVLSKDRQRRLEARIDRLHQLGVAPDAIDILGLYLANAPEQEAARIKPLALARRFGVDESAMIDVCLRAVTEGLLQLQWDVICPLCRIPSGHRDTLKAVQQHESCPTCDAPFQTDFASAIELVFRVHPDVRPVEVGNYCAGGPAHSPHVVAQVRLSPGERVELELNLTEGLYRIRGPQLPWTLDLRVANGALTNRWELAVDSSGRGTIPTLSPNGQVMVFTNGATKDLIVRIERATGRDDVLTAARAMGVPAFRELFPGELLSPGQLAAASTITLFIAQTDRSEEMFKVMGEARAFQLIQAGFRVIEAQVKAAGGIVIKTIGEGILASFAEVSPAVQTALNLPAAIAADPHTGGLPIKIAIHRGMAMIATVNDRLDYFGKTPRIATRLLDAVKREELAISVASATDHDANELFQGRPLRITELGRETGTSILTYVVKLNS